MTLTTRYKMLLALVAGATCYAQGTANAVPVQTAGPVCPAKAKKRTFDLKDTGAVVEGSVCVSIRYNALRYSSQLGRTFSYTAGPNLSGVLQISSGAAGAVAPPPPLPAGDPIEEIRKKLEADMFQWNGFAKANDLATSKVNKAATMLAALVAESDDIFQSNGAQAVLDASKDAALQAAISDARNARWTPSDDIQADLRALRVRASLLLISTTTDPGKTALTTIVSTIDTVLADVAPSTLNGDKAAAFAKQQAIGQFWVNLIQGLTILSFEKSTYVSCGVRFNQNEQIAVRLYTADRTPSFASQPIVLSDAKDPFVTVNCASPFVVSAGVEMRFLKTSTFGLVPSGTSGANQFGVTSDDARIPMPIAMAHVRLREFADHRYAVLASFGAAAHTQGNGTAGSAAEYLAGLSWGFFRTMFVTAGVHFGKVSALGGGYKIGDPVPTGVTSVPVTGSYKAGFGLAFTFTKP